MLKENMKIPVDRKRTLINFVIADLIFAALLFASCMFIFLFQKWNVVQYLIIALYVIISIFMLVLSLTRNYYVIERDYLVVVKGNKEMYYHYNDVVYIDRIQSEKKRVLCFALTKATHVTFPLIKKVLFIKLCAIDVTIYWAKKIFANDFQMLDYSLLRH